MSFHIQTTRAVSTRILCIHHVARLPEHLSMKEGSLFVLFVIIRSTELGCFRSRSWSLWFQTKVCLKKFSPLSNKWVYNWIDNQRVFVADSNNHTTLVTTHNAIHHNCFENIRLSFCPISSRRLCCVRMLLSSSYEICIISLDLNYFPILLVEKKKINKQMANRSEHITKYIKNT